MKVSTKGRYGLRFLVELAKNYKKEPVLLRKISENQNISFKYLEQIAILLRNAGLIKAYRGKNGGYILTRSPDKISIYEILKALEGEISIVDCIKLPQICERYNNCETFNLWKIINDKICFTLKSLTLNNLLKGFTNE